MTSADSANAQLVDQIMSGVPVVGDIASSHRWLPDRRPHADLLSSSDLVNVLRSVRGSPLSQHSPKLAWKMLRKVRRSALSSTSMRSLKRFGLDPDPRFEVVQKHSVRGVDSATSNGINIWLLWSRRSSSFPPQTQTWQPSSGCDRGCPTRLFGGGSWMSGGPIGRSRPRRLTGSGAWSLRVSGSPSTS